MYILANPEHCWRSLIWQIWNWSILETEDPKRQSTISYESKAIVFQLPWLQRAMR